MHLEESVPKNIQGLLALLTGEKTLVYPMLFFASFYLIIK